MKLTGRTYIVHMLWHMLPMLSLPLLWLIARNWAYDDPFITYRYAANLRDGLGFVYNPALRALSTTTPLYTLILSLLGFIWMDIPLVSNILGTLCLVGAAGLFIGLLPHDMPLPLRALGGFLLVLMPEPLNTLGSEMPLYILLILGALRCAKQNQASCAGLLSGLATVTRGDGILVFLIILLGAIRHRDWQNARLTVAGFGLGALPWYLFSRIYFGTWLPLSLGAKQAQRLVNGGYGFLRGLLTTLNFLRKDIGNLEFLLVFIFVALGLLTMLRLRSLPALLQWGILYIVGYSLLQVRYYSWYYAPLFPVGLWLLLTGLRQVCLQIENGVKSSPFRRGLTARLMAVMTLALCVQAGYRDRYLWGPPSGYVLLYRDVGRWLADNTPAQANVGALQIGVMGYYDHRAMVDFAGLIEPDVTRAPGTSYVDWAIYAIRRYIPDYVALDQPWGEPIQTQEWFRRRYISVHACIRPDAWTVVIYKRRGR